MIENLKWIITVIMFLDINRLQYFANHFSILTNSDLVTLEIDQINFEPEGIFDVWYHQSMPTKYCFKCYIHLLINSDDIPLEEQIFNVLNSNKNIVTMAVSVSIFWGTFLHRVLEVKILTMKWYLIISLKICFKSETLNNAHLL